MESLWSAKDLQVDDLRVYFPYHFIYPEQYEYMVELKRALDAKGHCLLEMPTGTGKTITLLSLITSYQLVHPVSKLIYCTRTVHEMEKVLSELRFLHGHLVDTLGRERFSLLALGLSSRKNLCVHPTVSQSSRDTVDAACRKLTAPWIRASSDNIETCGFYEESEKQQHRQLPPGVYSLSDLKQYGRNNGLCPYFLARYMIQFANIVVCNYQYLIDPKVSGSISNEMLQKDCIVVFDEAHNIDNVCIEALSVNLRDNTLNRASDNISKLRNVARKYKEADATRLQEEYNRLVNGLASEGNLQVKELGLANPVLPDDVIREAVPGNIRKAEHFISLLQRAVEFLRDKLLNAERVEKHGLVSFTEGMCNHIAVDKKALKFCYDRLNSLLSTLEVSEVDEFQHIQSVCDFLTLLGTYTRGFSIIIEPFDERLPHVPDPVLQLVCLDASLAMKPVFDRFQSVVITSGTLSPLDLYPRLLNFTPVVSRSLPMSLSRECLCPMVLARGSDQLPVSTKFDTRSDPGVVRNYGKLLIDMAATVPDGLVCFFVSYSYMEETIDSWNEMGILEEVMKYKLVFMETRDSIETSLALSNYRQACDVGRGAVFFSVARGKGAEGIDFGGHYGRLAIVYGMPFQCTLSKVLNARLEYLRESLQIKEDDFLNFDAMRQAAQCVGRVIRSKADYGMMIFADKRYNLASKRQRLPNWIISHLRDAHLNLSTDMAVHIAREFLKRMVKREPDVDLEAKCKKQRVH